MKKFALLFALFASIGLAQAEVGVFGTLDAGYNSSRAPGQSTSTTNFQSGGMTTSFWGIKGNDKTDSGLNTVFEVSSFFNDGTGSTLGGSTVNTFARSAFVGAGSGSVGTVTMGRQSNPSFLPTILFNAYGDSGAYSPLWHATYFGNTGNQMTQLYNDTAWDNSVAYETPSIAGAKATVVNSRTNGKENNGANVMFFKGDLGVTAYTQRTTVNSTGSFQNDIFTTRGGAAVTGGVGGSYNLKVAKVFATWQKADDNTTNQHGKTSQVSALVPAGKGNVMAEYAYTTTKGATSTNYREYAVGYDYNMSPKTDVYATAGRTAVTGTALQGQTIGAGLRVRF